MKSFQTSHTIANEVRLKRARDDSPFLIVEGADDSRFLRRFVDPRACSLVPAFNKDNVIGAISLLDGARVPGVLGVVDSDFDVLVGTPLPSNNIVRCDDSHDLETMLIRSPALDVVLHEFASPEKLDSFQRSLQVSFRTWLVQAALGLGYLRWYSTRGTNLCFDGLRFARFFDIHSLALDRAALFVELRNKSKNWAISDADFVMAGWPEDPKDDPWHVCCGHDMVDILALALRRAIGSQSQLNSDQIAGSLRLAYSEKNFAESKLCVVIKDWERANGVRILR